MSHNHPTERRPSSRFLQSLIVLTAIASSLGSPAMAQSTSTHIFGQGPAGAKVDARSTTGAHRSTTIRDDGHYDLRSLPMGVYTVSVSQHGTTTDTRKNIRLTVGRGAEVDFACPHDQCGAGTAKSP